MKHPITPILLAVVLSGCAAPPQSSYVQDLTDDGFALLDAKPPTLPTIFSLAGQNMNKPTNNSEQTVTQTNSASATTPEKSNHEICMSYVELGEVVIKNKAKGASLQVLLKITENTASSNNMPIMAKYLIKDTVTRVYLADQPKTEIMKIYGECREMINIQ